VLKKDMKKLGNSGQKTKSLKKKVDAGMDDL
jgi:hypothetical protein